MRHVAVGEDIASCQQCGSVLTSRDVLQSGQGRLCLDCLKLQSATRNRWDLKTNPVSFLQP